MARENRAKGIRSGRIARLGDRMLFRFLFFFFRHDGDGRWGRFAVNGFLVGFGSVVRGRGRRGETVECVRAMALGVSVLVRTGSIVLFVMFVSAVGCQRRAHSETFCSDKRRGRNSLGITLVERSSRKVE